MKKVILFLVGMLMISGTGYSQAIYKGLETGMSKKEAKNEFKNNKDQYTTIDLGNGFLYRIYTQNFDYVDDKLVGVLLSPKGSAMGQSYEHAVSYLNYSREFFEDLNYELISEPEYWNAPVSFSSKYGLLMANPEKTVMVQLYPVKYGGSNFIVKLQLYNYDQFMSWYDSDQETKEEKVQNSGF